MNTLKTPATFQQSFTIFSKLDGYINTRGRYFVNGDDVQFYTSLNGDTVVTEKAKYDASEHDIYLEERTETPLSEYMNTLADLQDKIDGGLYDAIQHLHSGNIFSITSNFRSRPTTLES